MNPWGPVVAGLAMTALIQLAVAVYVYGRLTQRVDEHDKKFDANREDHGKIFGKLDNLGERVGKIEGRLGPE